MPALSCAYTHTTDSHTGTGEAQPSIVACIKAAVVAGVVKTTTASAAAAIVVVVVYEIEVVVYGVEVVVVYLERNSQ